MIKLFFLIVIAFAALLAIAGYWQKTNSSGLTENIRSTRETGPSATVRKFWLSSLQGQNFEAEVLLTTTPKDYYKIVNYCAEATGENARIIASNPPGITPLTKGVDDYKRKWERDFLTEFSSRIQREEYSSFNIKVKKQTDDHAIVEIAYGKESFHHLDYFKDNFLLVKENDDWKIFMVTSNWDLSNDNKLFAETDCSNY